MGSTPYLFEELNPKPRPYQRRRREPSFSPGVRKALASLEQALHAIPAAEWEVRRRRWEDLQRELKGQRREVRRAKSATPSEERSEALAPTADRTQEHPDWRPAASRGPRRPSFAFFLP